MDEKTLSKEMLAFAPWWVILINGIMAVILGIYLVIQPVKTMVDLAIIIGLYLLLTGALGIIQGFMDKSDSKKILYGALGILAGLLIVSHPLFSGIVLPSLLIIIVGILGLLMGFIGLFYVLKGDWSAGILGLLSIIFGLLLIGSPVFSLALLASLAGGLFIFGGLAAVLVALRLR